MSGSVSAMVRALAAPLCAPLLVSGVMAQSLAPDIVVTKVINAPVAVMGSLEKRFASK